MVFSKRCNGAPEHGWKRKLRKLAVGTCEEARVVSGGPDATVGIGPYASVREGPNVSGGNHSLHFSAFADPGQASFCADPYGVISALTDRPDFVFGNAVSLGVSRHQGSAQSHEAS